MFSGLRGEFSWSDWLVFGVVLAISFGIGIYHAARGRQGSTMEYFVANKQLTLVPVTLSMFMSYISGITILGNSAEFYTYGAEQWITGVLGNGVGYVLAAFIFVPLFYNLQIVSSFEYLEMRFNSLVIKRLASVLAIIYMFLYMAIGCYSPAIALNAVSPIPTWASIIVTGLLSTIYTTLGGMKAVIWTDVFQGVVLFAGLLAVIIIGAVRMGGMGVAWAAAGEMERTRFFNFDTNPVMRMSFWSIAAGAISMGLQNGISQSSVQRYIALPSKAQAKGTMLLSIPLYALVWTLAFLLGVLIFGYYHLAGCDPLRTGIIYSPNQLAPYYVLNALNIPALSGVFVSVLFAGALRGLLCILPHKIVIFKLETQDFQENKAK